MNSPIVYITITGMFLSVLLFFYNKGYKSANAYLAGFLFLSSLFVFIQFVFLYSHNLHLIIWFVAGLPSLFYLIGPLAYIYVRSILRDNTRLSRLDYLHFLICILVFIGAIPYIFSNLEQKLMMARAIESNNWSGVKIRLNAILPPMLNRTLRPIHLLVYAVVIWLTIYKYKAKLFKNSNHSHDFLITKKWLLVFSGFVPLIAIFYVLIFYNTTVAPSKTIFILHSYPLLVIFSIIYVLMIASLLFFPHILYGMPVKIYLPSENLILESATEIVTAENKESQNQDKNVDVQQQLLTTEKYLQLFPEDYLQELNDKINKWIEQKHFLDPETNISTLAVQIKIPQHHLNYYFNTILEVKFTDWRNNLKIDYATTLIDQGTYKSITLEALSLQCGYLSQSTFIRAFKNAKGVTPSEYMKGKGGVL